MNQGALDKIKQVRQRYILYHLLADALLSAAIAIAGALILHIIFNLSYLSAIVLFAVVFGAFIINRRLWQTDEIAVTGFLNASYPELEESSGLLLLQTTDLNLLQQLQVSKLATVIEQIPANHKQFTQRLRLGLILLISALILAFAANSVNLHKGLESFVDKHTSTSSKNTIKEVVLPQIASVNINITPPAYTNLSAHHQDKFTLQTVEGASVNWILKTNIPVQKISLLFNDQEVLNLTNPAKDRTTWQAQKTIIHPGFYQVLVDGKRSDLYQIQVTKDEAPVIQIKMLKQYTYIDAGEKPQVNLRTIITDDYGISDATIFATVAKGSGEAVKFKEQKISFGTSFSKTLRSYELQKTIDLPALGLEPGDELYFYIQAQDNHAQLSRTDVYIVSIQDTAQLLSMDGILSGADIKPEYFRSERQIILDAESLIKVKDTLSLEKFKDRSNELGTDQKLLRLRYGKFLGEEAEGNIADPREAGNDKLADPKDFGNGAKILDEYTDKHDNAEDAQFFDPTVKAQLKATLTEMWKAELQLRLYKPQDALPFAYKALRLLKNLQEKSRSYVAKTAYNPSPLKMEKRLSGDLSKIIEPMDHEDLKQTGDRFLSLKSAAALLQQLPHHYTLTGNDYKILQAANLQIGEKAAAQPGTFLSAASAMRRILNSSKKNLPADIAIVEMAIEKILPGAQSLPQSQNTAADMGFSKAYFLKLNR